VKHILVVDDEPRIAEIVKDYLERAGYGVTLAANGADALTMARARRPDLIVLDLGLPRMDGLEVTRALRAHSNVPIIMLTARVEESDKLIGLELGADDYVTKPFSPKELVARVRAVFRRIDAAPERGDVIRVGEVTIDKPRMRATIADRAINLTPTEFELLTHLATRPGVYSRERLLSEVWGYRDGSGARTVDSHIRGIRRKLGDDVIRTVHGVGYALGDQEDVAS
jgi:DNA-binding response OmpR family regulator